MDRRGLSRAPGARRRLTAAAALVAVVLGVGAIVTAGNGHPKRAHPSSTPAKQASSSGQGEAGRVSHAGWRAHRGPVPILMYHAISTPGPGVRSPLLYVSGKTFAAQMRWLDRQGYQAVTLDQVEEAWGGRGLLPRRPIVVSFDDGYYSQYHTAMPVLRGHHWAGVLSLCLGNMKRPGGAITADQVQKLVDSGWELASHTISHRDLRSLSGRQLRHELRDSRRIIRYVFRVPVHSFTYPAGLYAPATVRAVRAAGYRAALTVTPGLGNRHQPYELRRVRVVEAMKVRGLADELKSLGV